MSSVELAVPEETDYCERCSIGTECPFCSLTGEAREVFRSLTELRYYACGAEPVRQGERPDGLFIVRRGVLDLRHDAIDGHSVVLGMVGEGGLLGLSEVITGSSSRVTAEARRPATLEMVPRQELVSFLMRFPDVAVPLLVRAAEDLDKLRADLVAARHPRPLTDQLLDRLRSLADVCGVPVADGVLIDVPLTVQALGDRLGCSRQWASRLLGEAEGAGLVKRQKRRIVVTKAALNGQDGAC
jgi:CRP-like cAMP-binding protein